MAWALFTHIAFPIPKNRFLSEGINIGYPIQCPGMFPPFRWMMHRKRGLRGWIVSILASAPKNGAESMDEIETMTQGWRRPSPGSVYPLLEPMTEEDLVRKRDEVKFPFHGRARSGFRRAYHKGHDAATPTGKLEVPNDRHRNRGCHRRRDRSGRARSRFRGNPRGRPRARDCASAHPADDARLRSRDGREERAGGRRRGRRDRRSRFRRRKGRRQGRRRALAATSVLPFSFPNDRVSREPWQLPPRVSQPGSMRPRWRP